MKLKKRKRGAPFQPQNVCSPATKIAFVLSYRFEKIAREEESVSLEKASILSVL
jgi:hypothetical protein